LGSDAVQVAGVTMLGVDGELAWSQDGEGLKITPPVEKPCDHAYTFKVTLAS
jgi:alpha-L-fucosidase